MESQFCASSLCFKTDQVTVKERVDLVERQRSIAWAAIHQVIQDIHQVTEDIHQVIQDIHQVFEKSLLSFSFVLQELSNFSSLLHQLSSMGYTSDIHEVLMAMTMTMTTVISMRC